MHGKRGRHKDAELPVINRVPLYFVQAELYRLHRCRHGLGQSASRRGHCRLPASALK
jgi:hypothetical protein